MAEIDNTTTYTPKTQLDIQEEILQKISGMSTDQLSALSVIVDQIKESNSTLVAIKEGLDGATIYKDKIVYVPKEVIKFVEKEVVIDDKLRVENEQLKEQNNKLSKENSQLENSVRSSHAVIVNLETANRKNNNQLDEVLPQLSQSQKDVERLKEELKGCRKSWDELSRNYTDLRNDYNHKQLIRSYPSIQKICCCC